MSVSTRLVRISAATLPRAMRDRYREQWLADVRDAEELGLHPGRIAAGSLAFAATVRRPLPTRPDLAPAQLVRREYIARLLAFGAAMLGLSQYASMASNMGFGDNSVPDGTALALGGSLTLVVLLGSVLAVLVAFGTRGVSARTRIAVALFLMAATAPIVQSCLSADVGPWWNPAMRPSAIPYLSGAVLVLAGAAVIVGRRRTGRVSRRAIAVAGSVVLAVAIAALSHSVILWMLRPPLAFGNGPRSLDNPIYAEWLRLKVQFEALMVSTFVWWGVGLLALVIVFVVAVAVRRLTTGQTVRLAIGTSGVILVAAGGLLGFLQMAQSGIAPVGEVAAVLTVGRLLLVGGILSALRAPRRQETWEPVSERR